MRAARLLRVVLAALLAGLVAAAVAASAPPPLKPITEGFTVLPCPAKPSTTLELEGCAEHRILASDRQIEAAEKKVYAELPSTGKTQFVAAEGSWLRFRRSFCLAESSIFSGGSIEPVVFGNCVAGRNAIHLKELADFASAVKPGG